MEKFYIFIKGDAFNSLVAIFLLSTWIFCPRKNEYINLLNAWIIFLISELLVMTIFFSLCFFKIIPDVSNVAFNAIYWIVIGVIYISFVRVIRITLERKFI